MKKIIYGLALSILTMAVVTHAKAATYPAKPVNIVVGFSAGGPTDVVIRAFANFAGARTGKNFIVENKPGANSIIATQYVSQARPDGYTLLGAATNYTMIPALYGSRIKFDVEKSFTPICTFAKSPTVLVVGPSFPVASLNEFLEHVRKSPGKFSAASAGVGSSGDFATALFEKMAGVHFNHIPYNGAAPAINALMGGQVDMSFATLASVLSQVGSGRIKILAVASSRRLQSLPKVPTFEEEGIKGYSADAWYGLLAPVGTPQNALSVLTDYVKAFQADPDAQKRLKALGLEPDATCGFDFASEIKTEVATYTELAKRLGLKN
ncbi:Bug family tripartite tricarboxylate transporter substrate binding protein [Paralcaligenes ureilyticus]|uniref:Tripartite-type tricarboxylate transporter receptor subunit TctC n=1 Tax=Paralcaligenes ureilyticus TaxID=627131 RepID=A0A4R3LTY3_9BURK|nr:tripartite tricarboxylate transporter substrate binding protein [Paralcaligenes ureilyticus]TCT03416.1 tripartite-type tricarboxylate transporter receptor subunit TctC [Paralcaligenes ureilyticus]